MPNGLPTIPETITVHLGPPGSDARNVTVPFVDYIKNVASSEIYPTWPESAIRANIYAQISFALNRIYTEYYRSRGYDFDITNTTQNDQYFVEGRDYFENISQIVDEIFDSYIRRQGAVEPLFAQYCDGVQTQCPGLSQWGTVTLAEEGLFPYAILQNYYGNNIDIVMDVPLTEPDTSVPSIPLRLGMAGDDVRRLQIRLNRISKNYPAIPKISPADGYFGGETEEAVREFQRIFNLTPDGVVGRATWYSILRIYNSVKKIANLNSEGITLEEVSRQFPEVLQQGSEGTGVRLLQYFLSYIAAFVPAVQPTNIDGFFGPATTQAVRSFQQNYSLPVTGVVDETTWYAIYNAYQGLIASIPPQFMEGTAVPYPGFALRVGTENEYVSVLQEYLNYIGKTYTQIPFVPVTGYFGALTYNAVSAFQRLFGLEEDGVADVETWNAIIEIYEDLYSGSTTTPGQYPGYTITEG
ncbi:MAG: peptidoglycan-binding protein [Clostridia bacterium]|nr:peptidoglycan-binding protein [Clostridia bacterium]